MAKVVKWKGLNVTQTERNDALRSHKLSTICRMVGLPLGLAAVSLALPMPAFAKSERVFFGSHGTKFYAGHFDSSKGTLSLDGPAAENPRPTWAVRHPALPILYIANNTGGDGKSEGTIETYAVSATGTLIKQASIGAGAGGPTYLTFDRISNTLLAADYAGVVASFAVGRDGSLLPVSVVKLQGTGPHRRQDSAHAHSVAVAPGGRFVLVPDLGSDRVWSIPLDRKSHTLGPAEPESTRHFRADSGSGPRHIAVHPSGRFVYVVSELTAKVEVLGWNDQTGALTPLGSVETNSPDHTGESSASEIRVSRDGRFLYTANRRENRLLVYAIDAKNGSLKLAQRIASGGILPWHFAFDASARWLIAANRDADELRVFSVNKTNGNLTDTGRVASMPKPVFVEFFDR